MNGINQGVFHFSRHSVSSAFDEYDPLGFLNPSEGFIDITSGSNSGRDTDEFSAAVGRHFVRQRDCFFISNVKLLLARVSGPQTQHTQDNQKVGRIGRE